MRGRPGPFRRRFPFPKKTRHHWRVSGAGLDRPGQRRRRMAPERDDMSVHTMLRFTDGMTRWREFILMLGPINPWSARRRRKKSTAKTAKRRSRAKGRSR